MLKLKRLQILGFKSFCDRTELKFHGDGVAAIIGPNGCGKSNISDAISWVLGEQSAKTLRGARMEDVIFAGTRDRKPTGMAEVSLTLIDPEAYAGQDANAPTEVDIQDDTAPSRLREGLSDANITDDWDEASIRARAAQATEQAVEDAQPGKTEEIEIPRSKVTINAVAFPDDEPIFALPAHNVTAPATAASVGTAAPHVVLKIRRRKFNQQQFRHGEIVVTRRLFRSGDSEYLLNGKLCRLRDIQELFMGTGLGPESYALIEQGRIGQILSSRPTDRRAILEEAAGITKFKTKKRLAEARLEDAKLNLSRINDIFDEVTRQMNSLKRQASKAERYARLREEMRAKLRLVLASKFAAIEQESAELDFQLNTLAEEMQHRTEAVQQFEAEHAERTQRGYSIESEQRENRERISQIALEIDRGHARRRHNEERCAELLVRTASSEAELAQARHRLTALESERESNRQILESAAADLAAAQSDLALCQQDAAAAAASLAEIEHQQEESRVAIFDTVSSASRLRNQLAQAEERLAGADREARRLETEITNANTQVEAFGGQRGQLALEFESVTQRVSGITEEISQLRRLIEQKKLEETRSKTNLDVLRAEYATALGKKGSLEAVIAEHGYSTESVRRLFQSGVMQSRPSTRRRASRLPGSRAALRARSRRFPPRRTELRRREILGRRRRRPAHAPHRSRRPRHIPRSSRGRSSQVLVRPRRSRTLRSARGADHSPEKYHSRAERLRQIVGSHSAQAARRLHRPRIRRRARPGARKSRRILPLPGRRVLPQRHRHWRQTARGRPALHEARTARSPPPARRSRTRAAR